MAASGGLSSASVSGDILIVDDDEDIRETVAAVLVHAGYHVRTTANGREAVAAIEQARPALVLLDLMMPLMSGWEVVDWVKTYGVVAPEQILVMTANHDQCPTGFLPLRKPFDLSGILAAIRKRLAERS